MGSDQKIIGSSAVWTESFEKAGPFMTSRPCLSTARCDKNRQRNNTPVKNDLLVILCRLHMKKTRICDLNAVHNANKNLREMNRVRDSLFNSSPLANTAATGSNITTDL